MKRTQSVPVQAVTPGPVPGEMTELASSKVGSVLRLTGRPVLFARVTLALAADPAVERPAVKRELCHGGQRFPGGDIAFVRVLQPGARGIRRAQPGVAVVGAATGPWSSSAARRRP